MSRRLFSPTDDRALKAMLADGLSHGEIAAVLGRPKSSIGSRCKTLGINTELDDGEATPDSDHLVPTVGAFGIVPGSAAHRLLLALRAPGGLTGEQANARVEGAGGAIARLVAAGLITRSGYGKEGVSLRLTDAGREVVSADGPLSRRKTEITYLQP